MRDVLSFHPTGHGTAVRLVAGRSDLIERDPAVSWCGGGVAFSARPVKPGQKVRLEVRHRSRHHLPGSLRIGFTSHDPATLIPGQLPPYLIPDLTDTGKYWARAVNSSIGHGSLITVTVDVQGNHAYWDVCGLPRGILVDGLDVTNPLWLVVDLYGPVTGLRLVPSGTCISCH
jgi:protein neuralized